MIFLFDCEVQQKVSSSNNKEHCSVLQWCCGCSTRLVRTGTGTLRCDTVQYVAVQSYAQVPMYCTTVPELTFRYVLEFVLLGMQWICEYMLIASFGDRSGNTTVVTKSAG